MPPCLLREWCAENMQQIYRRTPCQSVLSIKLLYNFEITLRHGCSPANLLRIFRKPFSRNTSRWLLLSFAFLTFTGGREMKHWREITNGYLFFLFGAFYLNLSWNLKHIAVTLTLQIGTHLSEKLLFQLETINLWGTYHQLDSLVSYKIWCF